MRWVGFALVAALLLSGRAEAQGGGDGFLFKAPSGSISFRTGFDRANAGSDVFKFATDQLTLGRGDFSSFTFQTDIDYRLTRRAGMAFGVSVSRSDKLSEFRHWVDNNNRAIEQTTTFLRVPLTASIKAYVIEPGRSVGHFAWIPARFAPYVGGGGGVMWYRFRQDGDFIDFATRNVFPDLFDSTGWTPTVQGFAGTDISLGLRFAVTAEARYQWARARMGKDFLAFDRIDLSGLAVMAGISVRY